MFEALRMTVKSGRWLVGVIPLVTVCCGEGRVSTPTAPTSPTAAAPMPATIRGSVQDPAGRALVGARVEALDGPSAGTSATMGGSGYFDFTGTFTLTTRFRATYEDHESLIDTPRCSVPDCARGARPWMYFQLRPLAPPVDLAGDYALTLTAAEGCNTLPGDARSRNYQVSITPLFRQNTADVLGFNIDFRSASVLESMRHLTMGVAVDFISLYMAGGEGEIPAVAEDLGLNRYVAFTGSTKATLNRASLSKIDLAFDGSIDYVMTRQPMGNAFITPPDVISKERCTSSFHRLVLSRM